MNVTRALRHICHIGIGALARGADRVGITQIGLDPNQPVANCPEVTAL